MISDQEMQLVLLGSRKANYLEQNRMKEIIETRSVDWDRVMRYAARNKTLFLVMDNIIKVCRKEIPSHYVNLFEDAFYCNQLRNSEKMQALEEVLEEFSQNHIQVAVVKGAYLIDAIYNRRIRTSNDIDLLIRKKDIKSIDGIMKGLGYTNDMYDAERKCFIPNSRTKQMLYKLKMYNLLPYAKIGKTFKDNVIFFDLSFSLDFDLDTRPVEEMIDKMIKINGRNELCPEHFLIHMCCHHYREASHTEWIKMGKDLTLMKFCDVREFVREKVNEEVMNKAICFAQKYNLEKAVYFTFYFLNEIYHDGYEEKVLKKLNISNPEFVFEFGQDEYELVQIRKKDFWSGFFDDDNKDELTLKPKYEELLKNE